MAKQRFISHKDGSVISSGHKSTTKNRKGKDGKNPPKKGSDAKKKSRHLRGSLTSSPLNSGLDSTGKPHIKKPPDRKSQGKPGTNESETNDEDKLNEEVETANSDLETNKKSLSIDSQNTAKNHDESILKDSIEENKRMKKK